MTLIKLRSLCLKQAALVMIPMLLVKLLSLLETLFVHKHLCIPFLQIKK